MKIFIGADHRGFELKGKLIEWLNSNGYQTQDCGAFEYNQGDDYPDFAKAVAQKVNAEEGSRGIVICATGIGADIVSNRSPNIRCGLGFNIDQIKKTRGDDDINILALASMFTSEESAKELVQTFLQTEFQPTEKHTRRLEKI